MRDQRSIRVQNEKTPRLPAGPNRERRWIVQNGAAGPRQRLELLALKVKYQYLIHTART